MKRSIALVLIVALVVAMSVTVSATDATEGVSGNSQEVLASYEEGTQDKTVINVDISWEQMSFTYNGESAPAWNAEEHRYEGEATVAGWAPGNGTITIRNNSNAVLQAIISYNQEPAFDDVFMNFTDKEPYVGSAYTDDNMDAEGNVCGTPCEITIKAIPTGILPKETADNTRIGSITITLNAEVDVYEMLDDLAIKIDGCKIGNDGLSRGTPFLVAGTDANDIQEMVTAALETYAADNSTISEKNVAINKLLTSFYGALDIVQ